VEATFANGFHYRTLNLSAHAGLRPSRVNVKPSPTTSRFCPFEQFFYLGQRND
jgi:hypothetical protein